MYNNRTLPSIAPYARLTTICLTKRASPREPLVPFCMLLLISTAYYRHTTYNIFSFTANHFSRADAPFSPLPSGFPGRYARRARCSGDPRVPRIAWIWRRPAWVRSIWVATEWRKVYASRSSIPPGADLEGRLDLSHHAADLVEVGLPHLRAIGCLP